MKTREEIAKEVCRAVPQQCYGMRCKDCNSDNQFLPLAIADYLIAEIKKARVEVAKEIYKASRDCSPGTGCPVETKCQQLIKQAEEK